MGTRAFSQLRGSLRSRTGHLHAFRDQSLLVTNADGELTGGFTGFYFANTRMLSAFGMRLGGQELLPVQAHEVTAGRLLAVFQDPRITGDEHLQDRAVVVTLDATVASGLHFDLEVANHSLAGIDTEFEIDVDADFADSEETRTGQDSSKLPEGGPTVGRLQHAPVSRSWSADRREMRFAYEHPQLSEASAVRFSVPPEPCGRALWQLRLRPQERWSLCIDVVATHEGGEQRLAAACHGRVLDGAMPAWFADAAQIETSVDDVRLACERAVEDLAAMALRAGPPAEHAAFAAGIPIYQNAFGRDQLFSSWQAVMASPEPLAASILVAERYQGTKHDDFRDEQPGRIIQQIRSGPLNLLDINPRRRYYSDYASSPDFLIQVAQHFLWTGDRAFFRARLPAVRRVLDWIERYADLDGDGLFEYQTRSPNGDRNQGWKDSARAIPYEDGLDAELPIATCELQGYFYVGLQQMAWAMLLVGQVREAVQLLRRAARLKRQFNERFWMADEGFFALALDGKKRVVRSIGSNAGHCLASGIVDDEYAPAVARRLFEPDLYSGWGVRTLSDRHPSYNPLSYHLGTVWPVEQATIAFGLKRYGFSEEANRLAHSVFELASLYQLHRLPEAVGGFPRDEANAFPAVYPQACWPQAWSGSAMLMLAEAMLGIWPIAPLGMLFVDPMLPEWLPDLTVRGLQVGDSRLTIRFRRRKDGSTGYRVLERSGRVRVVRERPDRALGVSKGARVLGPIRSLVRNGW